MQRTASRAVEWLRRALALALILGGAILFFWPGPELLVLTLPAQKMAGAQVDERQTRHPADAVLSGEPWAELVAKLQNPTRHPEIDRRSTDPRRTHFVFLPTEPPISSLHAQGTRGVHHLDVVTNEGRTRLELVSLPPGEIYGLPSGFSHPLRTVGIVCAVLGFLWYLFLPGPRFAEGDLRYARGGAVVAPDILGLTLTPFFALLPWLIVSETAPDATLLSFDGGWIFLTLPFWVMACFGLAFLAVGLHYAPLAYRVEPEGIRVLRGGHQLLYRYAEMDGYAPYETRLSSKLAFWLRLVGALTGTLWAMGFGIVLDGNNEHGVALRLKDGQTIRIMANKLDGFEGIVQALAAQGIPRKRS